MMEDPYYTDSIVRPGCRHFRLRQGTTVVGYLQINPRGSRYYSKDNFWWRKAPLDHTHQDRSTETFDANRQMIFEHDLLRIKKKGDDAYTKRGIVEFNAGDNSFRINLIEEGTALPFGQADPAAPFRDDLKVTGQLFGKE